MNGPGSQTKKATKKTSKKVAKKKTKKTVYATREPITELARVSFSMGITINKGNYESVRIDCSLDRSCYDDEIKVVQGGVRDTVEQWLEQATNECRNVLGITEQAEEEAHGDQGDVKTPQTTPAAQESADLGTPPWGDDPGKEPPISDEEIVQGDALLKELAFDG